MSHPTRERRPAQAPAYVPFDVVCVGEAMATVAPSVPVRLADGGAVQLAAGGADYAVATELAAMGVRVGLASRLGNDPLGDLVRARTAAAGVDVTLTPTDPYAPTGVHLHDPAPDNPRNYFYRTGSAAMRMDRSTWQNPRLTGTRIIHMSGITAGLSGSCLDLVRHGLEKRPVADALMSFDVSYDATLWRAAAAGPVLAELASHADMVFVSQAEAALLWGSRSADEVRTHLPQPGVLVVTNGGIGATVFGAGQYDDAAATTTTNSSSFIAGYLSKVLDAQGAVAC